MHAYDLDKHRPKVLLLGNGLLRSSGKGKPWYELWRFGGNVNCDVTFDEGPEGFYLAAETK